MNSHFPRSLEWDTPWTLCCHKDIKLNVPLIGKSLRQLLKGKMPKELSVILIPAVYADGSPVPVKSPHGEFVHKDLPVLMRTHIYAAAVSHGFGAEKMHAITSLATTSVGPRAVGSFPPGVNYARFSQSRLQNLPEMENDVESGWGYDMPVDFDNLEL